MSFPAVTEEGPVAVATATYLLDSQPCCLEFSKSHDLLVVGTYTLVEAQDTIDPTTGEIIETEEIDATEPQQRSGELLVYRVTEHQATLLQTKTLEYALLDLHFSPRELFVFAVATSIGLVCFFSIDVEDNGALTLVRSIQVCDPSCLVLSLAYRMPGHSDRSSLIAFSSSNGHIGTFEEGQDQCEIRTIPAHSEEAWTVAWSEIDSEAPVNQTMLYSGGDDSILCKHDESSIAHNADAAMTFDNYNPLSHDIKSHVAGVTAIIELPVQHESSTVLITGSYDAYIRVLVPPARGRGRSQVLAERFMGGGVWRISRPFTCQMPRGHGDVSFNVLASCMHAGARVLKIRRIEGMWTIQVHASFTEHWSMNYASDVRSTKDGFLFVSTSFKDRKLCIWNLNNVS